MCGEQCTGGVCVWGGGVVCGGVVGCGWWCGVMVCGLGGWGRSLLKHLIPISL